MYRISNGQAMPVTEEKTLRITSSGATDFTGQPLKIPAGSMLTAGGRVVPMPGGIRFTDGSAATTDTSPPPATPANAGAVADRASLPPWGAIQAILIGVSRVKTSPGWLLRRAARLPRLALPSKAGRT
ncbi:hypothetical protein [Verrucomicrobium spinosum]|uniref:hypothetical protein n=1 Tax=Verrucomicrobium spinosum TaxID=2736 RepID=UPI00094624B9|nr:hypothetical protein [Verrucomicrobium spinosum]